MTTPTKRNKTETKGNQKKLCKSRRMNGGCYIPAKAAKPTFMQPPTLVTMSQAATTGTNIFELPPNNIAQAQSEIGKSQRIMNFCSLCTPVGIKCPNNYLSSNHPKWSGPEEEKLDWDEDLQKEEERKNEEGRN